MSKSIKSDQFPLFKNKKKTVHLVCTSVGANLDLNLLQSNYGDIQVQCKLIGQVLMQLGEIENDDDKWHNVALVNEILLELGFNYSKVGFKKCVDFFRHLELWGRLQLLIKKRQVLVKVRLCLDDFF